MIRLATFNIASITTGMYAGEESNQLGTIILRNWIVKMKLDLSFKEV